MLNSISTLNIFSESACFKNNSTLVLSQKSIIGHKTVANLDGTENHQYER
jgi:hypothetical protein